MFKNAYAIAKGFTAPVVLSRLTVGGKCSSSIGSCVLLNEEGWLLTAFHIAKGWQDLMAGVTASEAHEKAVEAINCDNSLSQSQRRSKLSALGKLKPTDTRRCSAWWGRDGVSVVEIKGLEAADFAVCRLHPFDPSWISDYPALKDPTKDYEPGVSLCRLGFPFHHITPVWHADKNAFELPAGALPLPLFPIEGMLTRFAQVQIVGAPPPPAPILLLETSSPGLRGQSGGPIFDVQGTVWAIQSKTANYPLGFDPPVPGQPNHKEHQFLNVGLGVATTTIVDLLRQWNIKFKLSAY